MEQMSGPHHGDGLIDMAESGNDAEQYRHSHRLLSGSAGLVASSVQSQGCTLRVCGQGVPQKGHCMVSS